MSRPGELRGWVVRLLLSLAIGAAAGGLAFLVGRGIGGALLFWQQQQLFADVAGALGSGLDGPSNLRAARLELQRIDAGYLRISQVIGFGVAAVAGYLWLERRATAQEQE